MPEIERLETTADPYADAISGLSDRVGKLEGKKHGGTDTPEPGPGTTGTDNPGGKTDPVHIDAGTVDIGPGTAGPGKYIEGRAEGEPDRESAGGSPGRTRGKFAAFVEKWTF